MKQLACLTCFLGLIATSLTGAASAQEPLNTANSLDEGYITVTGFLGARINQDIDDQGSNSKAALGSAFAQALSIGWKYDTKAEGELLFSNSRQSVSITGEKQVNLNTDVQYIHLGGKILFTDNSPFSANIGLGAGITYFNPSQSQYQEKTALSANISGGLRYQLSPSLALRSELRVYATRFNTEKHLFCTANDCLLELDDGFYLQSEMLFGMEYKF